MCTPLRISVGTGGVCTLVGACALARHRTLIAMDATLPTGGVPGEIERIATPSEMATAMPTPAEPPAAPQRGELSKRLELIGALVTGVVGLEVLALLVGVSGGGPYRSVSDRIEV